jgi:hypothetical protein
LIISRYIDQILHDQGICLLDIGSSGSLDAKWDSLRHIIDLVGFDPNKEECARQNALPSKYRSSRFLPYAVHGRSAEETLYRTRSIYCYSLLRPRKHWLDRFSFHALFDVLAEDSIAVRGIGEIEELRSVNPDAIKIDVQGLELPILRAAGPILQNAFYVETETGFTENYEGETTFSQLDSFMRENAFLMFDINTNHRIARDNEFRDMSFGGEQVLWCEAVWLRDYIELDRRGEFRPDEFPPRRVRAILVLCALQRCYDYGLELAVFFCGKGLLEPEQLQALKSPDAWHLVAAALPIQAGVHHALAPVSGAGPGVRRLAWLLALLPARVRGAVQRAAALSLTAGA